MGKTDVEVWAVCGFVGAAAVCPVGRLVWAVLTPAMTLFQRSFGRIAEQPFYSLSSFSWAFQL